MLEHGTVLPGGQVNHPNARTPAILAKFRWTREVIAGGKQITEIVPVNKREGFDTEQLAHLRARGVRAMITSTIRSGKKVIGSFSARLHKEHPDPTPDRRALMKSLAAHGALALEMDRLTEVAREGAIREERVRLAQEREQAARERAAELEHVNSVLSTSIENFAIEQGPEAFLDAILPHHRRGARRAFRDHVALAGRRFCLPSPGARTRHGPAGQIDRPSQCSSAGVPS